MQSIRRQLTSTILPGFGLLLVLSSTAIYFLTRAALLREFDASLQAKALTIMTQTEQSQNGIQVELPDAFNLALNHDVTPQFYELWLANGNVRTRAESLNGADLPRPEVLQPKPAYWNVKLPGDHHGRAIGLKFTPKPENEDDAHFQPVWAEVVVAADRATLDRTLAILAGVLLATGLLSMAITVPLVRISLRRGHAPLGQLAQQAAAITADSLETRFPVGSMPEELRPITARLNDLLGRLEASFERERRFSADLAHELRTPLAELRSLAEVELAWPEGETEKYQSTLNIALQMEAMVARLLELARCENGKITLKFESVGLAPLLKEVWRPLAVKARRKQLAFEFKVPSDATMQTDPVLLRSILANLLSNAVEYAPENGRGEIIWDGILGQLTVSNTVHDLNAADVPHLFERLWRKDKSRTGNDHCGLGLAVSQAFAKMLGFSLQARLNGETAVSLSLILLRN
jgi:two-component system sensor histidine kinase QseC